MSHAVWAQVSVKPEHYAEACAAVAAIVDETRAEPGCHAFVPHRAADGSSAIYIYEHWADLAAFQFHHAQSYTRAVYEKYQDWLASPVSFIELADLRVG